MSENAGLSWTRGHFAQTYDVHRHTSDANIVYGLTNSGENFQLIISINGGLSFNPDGSFPENISDVSGELLAVSDANH